MMVMDAIELDEMRFAFAQGRGCPIRLSHNDALPCDALTSNTSLRVVVVRVLRA